MHERRNKGFIDPDATLPLRGRGHERLVATTKDGTPLDPDQVRRDAALMPPPREWSWSKR